MILVLDNFRSMNNIGSVFRTADSFGVAEVYLCGICATPPHREIHKTALGATESVSWKYFADTLDAITALKSQGYHVIAAEQAPEAVSLLDCGSGFFADKKWAWVFGNEVMGVSKAVIQACDVCLEIPQWGTKKSLNVSVSVGVLLWHYISHRERAVESRSTWAVGAEAPQTDPKTATPAKPSA